MNAMNAALLALGIVGTLSRSAETGTMCTDNADFISTAVPPNPDASKPTCAAYSALMMTTMNAARGALGESWQNLDCDVDLAATREADPGATMATYLNSFGPTCCGGADKVRCYASTGTMCTNSGDFISTAVPPNPDARKPTCAEYSALILQTMTAARGALGQKWANVDCAVDMAAPRAEDRGATMRSYMNAFAPTCCGSADRQPPPSL